MKPWSARVGFAGCLLGFVLSIPLWLDASPVTLPDAPSEGPDEHTLNPIQAGRPAKAAEVQHNFKVLAGAVNELTKTIHVKDGNVGIGWSDPQNLLTVIGTPAPTRAHLQVGLPAATSGEPAATLSLAGFGLLHAGLVWIPNSSTDGKLDMTFGPSDNPAWSSSKRRFTFRANGTLGIGTTDPNVVLDARSTTEGMAWINVWDGSGGPNAEPGIRFGITNANTFATPDAARIWAQATGADESAIHFTTYSHGIGRSPKVTIDHRGRLGVGTAAPESSLHVAGDIATSPTIGGVHLGKGAGTESALIQLAGIGGEALIDFTAAAGEDADYRMGLRNDGRWKVGPGTGPQAIVIESNGKVGIGGSVPTTHNATLYVLGIGAATGGWINASDARWKKDVETFTGALEAIERLRGVRYRWRREEFPDMDFPEGERLGLVAQEVEGVLPELVHTDAEGTKSLEYAKLVAVLVEAIKEQQDRIDAQARVLEDVQRLLEDQQARLAALEAERARR